MSARPPFDAADEDRIVADMTRELELMTSGTPVSPAEDLADRIMAAVHDEPLPQPVRAFGLALVAGRLRAAGSAIGDSWRVATSGFAPAAVRAQALALVLVVVVGGVALAGGATVGAINLLTPNTPVAPSPSPSQGLTPTPSPSPSPSDPPSATTSPTATETTAPTATDDNGGRTPTPTATGTEDHGGGGGGGPGSGGGGSGSGSGSSGSGSGGTSSGSRSGSGGSDHTLEPTNTDDHGGGGG